MKLMESKKTLLDASQVAVLKNEWARLPPADKAQFANFENFAAYKTEIPGIRVKHLIREGEK